MERERKRGEGEVRKEHLELNTHLNTSGRGAPVRQAPSVHTRSTNPTCRLYKLRQHTPHASSRIVHFRTPDSKLQSSATSLRRLCEIYFDFAISRAALMSGVSVRRGSESVKNGCYEKTRKDVSTQDSNTQMQMQRGRNKQTGT